MNNSIMPGPLLDSNDPALFPKPTDEQMELLARQGTVRPMQVGEVFFREGDATYDVIALLEGRVGVTIRQLRLGPYSGAPPHAVPLAAVGSDSCSFFTLVIRSGSIAKIALVWVISNRRFT